MKYYKIIDDTKVIGIVSSDDFIHYSPVVDCFLRGTEADGEYITFENKLYRATWMCPIKKILPYIIIKTSEITEQEYDIYMEAYRINGEIEEEVEEEEENIEPINTENIDDMLDFIRTSKLNEMSYTCRRTIENGFDLELRGEIHHFSLDTQDQLNLISLSAMAQTQSLIPYHADGEMCIFYTAEEMNEIVATATAFKVYHTTYYNALKGYINSLETIEDIAAIEYGTPIPEEFKSDVLKALEQ